MTTGFGLLGALGVRDALGRPVLIRGQRPRAVLAMLLLEPSQWVPTEQIIQGLWAAPPEAARGSVHFLVHRLRKTLPGPMSGPGALVQSRRARPAAYCVQVDPAQIDVGRFQRLVGQAAAARSRGELPAAWAHYAQALGQWRGEPLADLAEAPFAQAAADRLTQQRLTAQEGWLAVGLELGRHAELLGELEGLVRAYPTRERLQALRMLALYRAGRRADALAVYQSARAALGMEPGERLQQLQRAVLAQDPSLALPASRDPDPSGLPAGLAPSVATAAAVPAVRRRPEVNHRSPVPTRAPELAPAPVPVADVGMTGGSGARDRERRVVTVLVGELLGGIGLEGLEYGRQQALLGQAHAAVVRYGGTVQPGWSYQVIGVFGAGQAREDDPERAVRAGLAIAALPGSPRRWRVGVETGQALVADGQVSSAATAVAVGLVARAPAGGVLVGPAAYQASWRMIDYDRQEEAGCWRALGPHATTGTLLAPVSGSSPLVERSTELRLLEHALASARAGSVQLVTVLGPAGIGKSRLVAEFARRVDADPALIAWRQTHAHSHTGGFGPLADLVAAQVGVDPADPPAVVGDRVDAAVRRVLADPEEAGWVAGCLDALLRPGIGDPHRPSGCRVDAGLVAGWVRFVEAVAADRPLVLVVEDAHQASGELLEFLEQLAVGVGGVPLLVVVTARPELLPARPGWAGGRVVTVSLRPLTADGSRQLFKDRCDEVGLEVSAQLRDWVLGQAAGNPLCLEEYVRMLTATARTGGAGGEEVGVPASIQQLIAARLDALPVNDRRLVTDLAVLGEPASVEALAALSGKPTHEVVAGLGRLEGQDWVRRSQRLPGAAGRAAGVRSRSWGFAHPLFGEVASSSLLRADRFGRHLQAVEWLEAQPDHPRRVERLAGHYQLILSLARHLGRPVDDGLVSRARRRLRAAGWQAMRLGALGQAAAYARQALALWPDQDPERPWVQLDLAAAQAYSTQAGHELAEAALGAFRARADAHGIAVAEGLLAHLARATSQPRQAAALVEHALAGEDDLTPERVEALAARTLNLLIADRYPETFQAADEVITLAERLGLPGQVANVSCMRAHARILAGDRDALADADTALAAMDTLNVPVRGYAHFGRAHAAWWAGDLPGCAAAVAAGQAVTTAAGALAPQVRLDAVEAGLAYAAGEWGQARSLAGRVLAADHARYLHPWAHILRGRMALGLGELDAARTTAAAALAQTRQTMTDAAVTGMGDVRYWQVAMSLAGRVALASGDRQRAHSLAEELLGWLSQQPARGCATPDLGWLLHDLAYPAATLPGGLPLTRWHAAVSGLADGDLPAAAEQFAAIGSRVDEAEVRLRLAQQLAPSRHPRVGEDAGQAAVIFSKAGAWVLRAQAERVGVLALPLPAPPIPQADDATSLTWRPS